MLKKTVNDLQKILESRLIPLPKIKRFQICKKRWDSSEKTMIVDQEVVGSNPIHSRGRGSPHKAGAMCQWPSLIGSDQSLHRYSGWKDSRCSRHYIHNTYTNIDMPQRIVHPRWLPELGIYHAGLCNAYVIIIISGYLCTFRCFRSFPSTNKLILSQVLLRKLIGYYERIETQAP